MGMPEHSTHLADVICQHRTDGTIIPMKIRTMDEDGEYQTFTVRSYKDMSHCGSSVPAPDGVVITNHTWTFQCKILVFGAEKLIRLFYNAYENSWKVVY